MCKGALLETIFVNPCDLGFCFVCEFVTKTEKSLRAGANFEKPE